MDSHQVCALRHKTYILTANMQLGEETIAELFNRTLVTKQMLDNIKDEIANVSRVVKYLEQLEDNPTGISRGSFNRLCDFLDSIDGFWWITDELRAELKTVRGELTISSYVRDEARKMVDGEFGPSKRLSDAEKLEIGNIVALRMQHYHEVWQRAIEAAKKKLEELNQINAEKEAHQQRLLHLISQYIRVQANLYQNPSSAKRRLVEKTDAVDVVDDLGDEAELLLMTQIKQFVGSLRTVSYNSLQARENVRGEKLRTLLVVGVDDINAKMEPEVIRTLTPIEQELNELNGILRDLQQENDERQAKLTAIIDDRTKRVAAADANIRSLNDHLAALTQRNIDLRGMMHQLQLKIVQTKTRIKKYRVKTDVMDDTRDKGYVAQKVAIVRVNEAERRSQRRGSIFDLSTYDNNDGNETVLPIGVVSARKTGLNPALNPVLVNKR